MPEIATVNEVWSWYLDRGQIVLFHKIDPYGPQPPAIITMPPIVAEMMAVTARQAETPIHDGAQNVIPFPRLSA